MLRLDNIKIYDNLKDEEILKIACNKNKVKFEDVVKWDVCRKSIDARDKSKICMNYSFNIFVKNEEKYKKIKVQEIESKLTINKKRKSNIRPVIVGMGPAGLFAGLVLARNGLNPIVIEQGKSAKERTKDIEKFLNNRKLDEQSNVQFGEGGAGTFSDGKLNSSIHSIYCQNVLKEFVHFGAPKEISYSNKPHIGTDNLVEIVQNMRKEIIDLGGEVHFNTKLINVNIENSKLKSINCENVITKEKMTFLADALILAIGHSSRDTFEMLHNSKLDMEKKAFAVGLRIEHKRKDIDLAQYGNKTKLKLGAADYKLVYHAKNGRTCYTFCMCPGGTVMASSSEKDTIVTNGMSKFARDGENSNSALLVNVNENDLDSDVLSGIKFQKELEEKAFKLGGSTYNAPIQRVEDFLNNKKTTKLGEVVPTYMPGVTFSNLNEVLPEFVSSTLKEGIIELDKKLKGFANKNAILTGVETRSSSPVRIIRDDTYMSNIKGIYPCGEGAGYAGGIMSAAVDGIKCAIKLLENE